MTDNNDLLAGLEDEMSFAEIERRQEAFNKKVNKHIAVILSRKYDENRRLKSIEWLGESGEPRAITALAQVYEREKSPRLRKAAAYSLGMFKALEEALDGPPEEQQRVLDMLHDIVLHGKMGQRGGKGRELLTGILALLVVSFVGIIAAALVLGGDRTTAPTATEVAQAGPTATSEPLDPAAVLADLQVMYTALDDDSRVLLLQYNIIGRGEAQDCTLTFHDPGPYTLPADISAASPELAQLVADLNETEGQIREALQPFERSCSTQVPIPASQALTYGQSVIEAQVALADIPSRLAAINIAPSTTPPDDPPSATAEPTPDLPQAPPEAVDMERINAEQVVIQQRIDEMNSFRGQNVLLHQYWLDIRDSGSTLGCREEFPQVPSNYALPSDLIPIAPPELLSAVTNLNIGLELTRQSWQTFALACESEEPIQFVAMQIIATETARAAYEDANADLFALRQRG